MNAYQTEVLNKYPANEWVKPTNNGSNDYDVFTELFEAGQVERKIEPKHSGKTFIGNNVYFKHTA